MTMRSLVVLVHLYSSLGGVVHNYLVLLLGCAHSSVSYLRSREILLSWLFTRTRTVLGKIIPIITIAME